MIGIVLLYAIFGALATAGILSSSVFSAINSFLGLLGTIALIWGIISIVMRGPKTIFAYHIFVLKNCSAKEAFQESLQLSKGRLGQVFLHIMVFFLVTVVTNFLIGMFPVGLLARIMEIVVNGLLLSTWVIYTYLFLKTLQNPATTPVSAQ